MWYAKLTHPHGGEEKYTSDQETLGDAMRDILEDAGIDDDDDRQVTIEIHFEEEDD